MFDKASTHVNEEIIKYLNDNKIISVIIPAGFTRFLQPLDTSINKPFKLALKNSYLSFQQNHLNEVIQNTFSIKNEDIINMISQIWYNDSIIRNKVIIDSFLFCGISQAMDGSQDEVFRWPDLAFSINDNENINSLIINDLEVDDEEN